MARSSDFVDVLFSKYSKSRRQIVRLLHEEPDKILDLWKTYLPSDVGCQARMTSRNADRACQSCEDLGGICYLQSDKDFILECGKFVGKSLIIRRRSDSSSTYLRFDDSIMHQSQRIVEMTPQLKSCGFVMPERYISCDPLSNEILARTYLNNKVVSGIILIHSFQCYHDKYTLESTHSNWKNLKISGPERANEYLVQIAAFLHQTVQNQLVLGRVDADTILIREDPPSKMYDGVHIKGKFGLSLEYTEGSSITIGTTRIVSPVLPETVAHLHPKLKVWGIRYTLPSKVDTYLTVYSLDVGTRSTFLRHRRAGVPLYPGSLELYVTLIIMGCRAEMYKLLIGKYSGLWGLLWVGMGDRDVIENQMKEWIYADYTPSYDEVIDLLLNKWLRCDAVSLTWEIIKEMNLSISS